MYLSERNLARGYQVGRDRKFGMVSDLAGLSAWEATCLCRVCDDEVPDEHFVVSHLLTSHSLAVCYEKLS